MKRRINSTGRKNIPLDKIAIRLKDGALGGARTFTVNLAKLTELGLDANGRVYVEPYIKSSSMRVSFGTVGALSAPADTRLTEIDSGGALLFRVMVVDEAGEVGKILAAANRIHPIDDSDEQDDQKAILPLRLRDLGEAVWQVDMESADRPELVINNRIPFLADRLKSDPLLQGTIIPHAMAEVIRAAMAEDADDELVWVQDWRKFASGLLGEEIPEGLEQEDLDDRIENVVQKFINRMKFATKASVPPAPSAGVGHD
ncbi:MAG: hypothetical protein WD823_12690 [Sulfuricaulis sp.]|uniref:hypothetical protein n=1 Tax=Sulfuricaulis sp. TaxID=2003553 RepID=UPI0034A5868D